MSRVVAWLMIMVVRAMTTEARPWAVVTGASSGIGRSIALEAASRGYNVVVAARRRKELDLLAAKLRGDHAVESLVVSVDLSTTDGATKLHRATGHLTASIELVVANAGFATVGEFVAEPARQIEQMISLNVASVASVTRLYGADLAAAGRGTLLLTSSLTALAPLPYASLYAATRAFVHSLAEGLAVELQPHNVSIHCLLPSATDTGFASTSGIESALAFTGPFFRPLGVATSADTVAEVALDAVAAQHSTDVYINFVQRCYALTARALLPRRLSGLFSSKFFVPPSPLSSVYDTLTFLPVVVPWLVSFVVAVPLTAVQEAYRILPLPLIFLVIFAALAGLKSLRNGRLVGAAKMD